MRIWMIKYGESIPYAGAGGTNHFFRTGEITRRLAARGHEVTWWTGRFEHQTKRHLKSPGNVIPIPGTSNSKVVLLDSPGYASNVSPKRFYDHWRIGQSLRYAVRDEPVPDVIVASMPTPELALAACDYAERHGVPLIMDVRDMWPDVIVDRIHAKLGFSPGWLLRGYERDVRHCLKRAQSVTAITRWFLEWAQAKGGRQPQQMENDRVFHLASREIRIGSDRLEEIKAAWLARGFDAGSGRTVFALAGALTNQQAMRAFLNSLTLLPEDTRGRTQVVLCGKGDLEGEARAAAQASSHVIYAGFVPRDEVQFLYDHSHFGLLMYDNTPDFQASFPNKFGEYLMSGLPVVTTVTGAIQSEYGSEGFVVTVSPDAENIAAVLSKLASAPPDAAIRARAREGFRRDFDAEIVYEGFCDHIEHQGL